MLPKIVSSLSKVLRTWEDCAILHSITSIMLLLWCIRYWGRGEHQRNDEIRTLSWSVIWNVLDRRKTQKSSHLPKSYISSEDNDPMHKTSLQKKKLSENKKHCPVFSFPDSSPTPNSKWKGGKVWSQTLHKERKIETSREEKKIEKKAIEKIKMDGWIAIIFLQIHSI